MLKSMLSFEERSVGGMIVSVTLLCLIIAACSKVSVTVGVMALLGVAGIFYMYYPFGVLLLLIALIPLDAVGGGSALSVTKLLFPPLIFLVLWCQMLQQKKLRWVPEFTWVLLFAVALLISLFFAGKPAFALQAIRKQISLFLLYFTVIQMVYTRRHIYLILLVIMISCLSSASAGLLSGHSADLAQAAGGAMDQRMSGLMTMTANAFATNLLVAVYLAAVFAIEDKNKLFKLFYLGIAVVCTYSIIFTFSRGSSLAFGFGGVVLAVVYRAKLKQPWIILSAAMAILTMLPFVPAEYWNRMATLSLKDFTTDISLMRRLSYHIIGLDLFLDSPVVGVGPANFPYYYLSQKFRYLTGFREMRIMHNVYFAILVEVGIIGFIPFMALVSRAIKSFLTPLGKESSCGSVVVYEGTMSRALLVSATAFFFSIAFQPLVYAKYTWLFFAMGSLLHLVKDSPTDVASDSHLSSRP